MTKRQSPKWHLSRSSGAGRSIKTGVKALIAAIKEFNKLSLIYLTLNTKIATIFTGLIVQRMVRSEEHTSELQSLMRISYAVFCLKKKKTSLIKQQTEIHHK